MGLIAKIFRAIFGFIMGFFNGIGKLLGLGGKSDYYVELDNAQGAAPSPESSEAKVVSPTQMTPEPKAESGASIPKAAAPKAPEKASAHTPQPATAAAATNGKSTENVTFAPNSLLTLSSTGSRRRPGPSLSPFKDMAREVQRSGKS